MATDPSRPGNAVWLAVGGFVCRTLWLFLPFTPGGTSPGFHSILTSGNRASVVAADMLVVVANVAVLATVLVLLARGPRERAIATGILAVTCLSTAISVVVNLAHGLAYVSLVRELFDGVDGTALVTGSLLLLTATALLGAAAWVVARTPDPAPAGVPLPPAPRRALS